MVKKPSSLFDHQIKIVIARLSLWIIDETGEAAKMGDPINALRF